MTQQETAKDIGARVIAAIEQSQIATREAERRAAQWEKQCKQFRAALDAAERQLGETQAARLVAEEERDQARAELARIAERKDSQRADVERVGAAVRSLMRGKEKE